MRFLEFDRSSFDYKTFQVTVECRRITEEDRKQHTSLPLDIDFRATIIWIGPCRPRNDREDPNR